MKVKMSRISVCEKSCFLLKATQEHLLVIGLGSVFLGAGVLLMFFGWTSASWLLGVIGFSFFSFIVFFWGMTLPWAIPDSYDALVIKKYGLNISATVMNKRIEVHSYQEKTGNGFNTIEEKQYAIDYEYTFYKTFKNTFYVYNLVLFDKVEIGIQIPIRILKTAPQKSNARIVKMGLDLGFTRKESN
ncbi:MAG: hypothetical protein COB98_04775 [Flavobacteriaceae bacterium]|nr:MAG: hypothetical protein COB98_04775 [Flavobacteriaceae bacterium]